MAIQKVDGVESVNVSLNEGFAEVKLKTGNKVTIEQLREIVRKSGFTAKESTVTVEGKLVELKGKPALDAGAGAILHLTGDVAQVSGKTGQHVVVSGVVPETGKKNEPETVEVKTVSASKG